MNIKRLPTFAAIVIVLSASCANALIDSNWSIEDNLKIKNVHRTNSVGSESSLFHYSPDGQYVAFIVSRNDLTDDEIISELRIYSIESLNKFLSGVAISPVFSDIVRTRSHRSGISALNWSPDSNSLFYLRLRTANFQLFKWSSEQGNQQEVTRKKGGVSQYKLLGDEKIAIFTPIDNSQAHNTRRADNSAFVATGSPLFSILLRKELPTRIRPHSVQIVLHDGRVVKEYSIGLYLPPFGDFIVSPSGRYVVYGEPFKAEWIGNCWFAAERNGGPISTERFDGLQISLLDLRSGEVFRPFNSPAGKLLIYGGSAARLAEWSLTDQYLFIPFTFTDAQRCGFKENTEPTPPGGFVVSVDERSFQKVYSVRPNEIGEFTFGPAAAAWRENGELELSFSPYRSPVFHHPSQREDVQRVFRHDSETGLWVLKSENRHEILVQKDVARPPIELLIETNYNTPPHIIARTRDGRTATLLDLAPHARDRIFGEVKEITWTDSTGSNWSGLLALPPNHSKSTRLPLILQTHDFGKETFFAEGPSTTAYPGRAALDRGFAVLTIIDTGNPDVLYAPRPVEASIALEGYRSGIEYLHDAKIIDRERVGLIGWSRTSYYVKHAISNAPQLFKAAVGVDGVDYGYSQYLMTLDWAERPFPQQYVAKYGNDPWSSFDAWNNQAPGFNVDKVTAPFLTEANSGLQYVLWEWEFYAGLRRLRKPSELVVYPGGSHSLFIPSHRKKSTEGSLDWLDFWINDVVDPAPQKTRQYSRWQEMRDMSCVDAEAKERTLPAYCK